jgi:hypothetical protein
MKLHETRNDLREKTRRAIIDLLTQELADVLDLGLQAKQAQALAQTIFLAVTGAGRMAERGPLGASYRVLERLVGRSMNWRDVAMFWPPLTS